MIVVCSFSSPDLFKNINLILLYVHTVLQICLFCRQRGHSLKNCRNKSEEVVEKKLCYNCGETNHSLSRCPKPLQDGMINCAINSHYLTCLELLLICGIDRIPLLFSSFGVGERVLVIWY